MKRMAWIGLGMAVLAMGLTGCDWDAGSKAESWSSDYNWVNFSGTYRAAGGGLLVSDYTTTPSVPGMTRTNAGSSSATLPAFQTQASGRVSSQNTPIVPGTFTVSIPGIGTLSDPERNGVLSGSGTGTITYDGGVWSINTAPLSSTIDRPISLNWDYTVTSGGSEGGGRPGSTRVSIYAFTVDHRGQKLTIIDSAGATYTGYISDMRTASGAERGDEEFRYMPMDGDTMIATFECRGHSTAGLFVRIVGTFQGTVANQIFTDRRLTGTWLEEHGKTGNINGQTLNVPIVTGGGETAPPVEG